jgi:sugar lactone lactonase YvrE
MLDTKSGRFLHVSGSSKDAQLLNRDHVRALYIDRKGTVWVGCGSPFLQDDPEQGLGGLYRYDKKTNTVKRFIHDDKNPNTLIDNRVRAIF